MTKADRYLLAIGGKDADFMIKYVANKYIIDFVRIDHD